MVTLVYETGAFMETTTVDILKKRPTRLFKQYAVRLVFRMTIFAVAILLFIFAPDQLSLQNFGLANFIDFVFIVLLIDVLTKFIPGAKIAMGSLKQYRQYFVPTTTLFENGRESLHGYIRDVIQQGRIAIEQVPERLRVLWEETRSGAIDSLKVLLTSFSIRKLLPFTDDQLVPSDALTAHIRKDRFREVVPVIIFWVVFNAAVAILFAVLGILSEQVILLWVLFYFVFDMICVVLWCPLQIVFMRNRCCTTCQIFNWDAIMTVTPLFLVVWQLSTAWFTWPLIALAAIVLIRWEAAFARHPERFDERTNSCLSCVNCQDKLCFIRDPLGAKLKEDASPDRLRPQV